MAEASAKPQRRKESHLVPVPPSSASVTDRGRLKDTPANRALRPEVTPQALFEDPKLTASAVYADKESILLQGDVKEQLRLLIDVGLKVDCIVTSPPYYGQRDYGIDGQMGLEDHPSEFLAELVEVFMLCRQVLRETGSLWINIGDTYWNATLQDCRP